MRCGRWIIRATAATIAAISTAFTMIAIVSVMATWSAAGLENT